MLKFSNGGRMVQRESELPDLEGAHHLYLDFETTSGDPKNTSLNPWFNCSILGACVTADDAPGAWYVPVRHKYGGNLSLAVVLRWISRLVRTCRSWVNHNVKYDAHVLANEGVFFDCELVCTLTLAKIIDSDRMNYGLSALSNDWLKNDVSSYERRIKTFLAGIKSKDYGDVAVDVMAEYGCTDVITNRSLYGYVRDARPDQCARVWDTEVKLTAALFDMERVGLRVDETELQIKELVIMHELLAIEQELHELTGEAMRPHVNDDCYRLLCGKYGLPVLSWTNDDDKKKNPSFDKDALASYSRHPEVTASASLTRVLDLMQAYRKRNTLNSFFVKPYQTKAVNGKIHPIYNQAVRTGRMSCKQPNAQQLSKEAKMLVHPDAGHAFASYDYSQIEFRWMMHYIKDRAAIAQYIKDPYTDFHEWVAEICGIDRDPAKNVNFAIGFGGGKARVLKMLASNLVLVREFADVKGDFDELCRRRANEVYSTYHDKLPGIKRCSRQAASAVKRRGHVFNAYGRRRHLPDRVAYQAFPSVVQSSAADLMKEKLVATAPRYCKLVRDRGISQVACVHDETLFHGPTDAMTDPETLVAIGEIMEDVGDIIDVPVVVKTGTSDVNWFLATFQGSFLGHSGHP